MFRAVNSMKPSNDRFIPRRMQVNFEFDENQYTSALYDVDLDKEAEFVNYAKHRYNYYNYQTALRNILLPLDTKILNFFPPKKFAQYEASVPSEENWPVKPRKKPVIGPPDMILDMPHFDSNIRHHVADWSSNNCLATIFEKEVHMWYPESEFLRATTKTKGRVQHCIKWKSDGKQFAVGLFPNQMGIWDIASEKLICETFCCSRFCEIYSLEWLHDGCLMTGCSRGVLKMHTSGVEYLRRAPYDHGSGIINIKGSCNKKFVATSGLDKIVVVWKMPKLEGLFQIKSASVIRALAWHPWKSALLAIGLGHNEGRVVIWNVNTHKQVACEKSVYKNCSINSLTFNPISGELVVSYFVPSERSDGRGSGVVAVLTNIDKVMEEIHIHNGPILYLLWGNEGRVLASVSADENLCIWNFFGSSECGKKLKEKTRRNTETYYESSNFFRNCIR